MEESELARCTSPPPVSPRPPPFGASRPVVVGGTAVGDTALEVALGKEEWLLGLTGLCTLITGEGSSSLSSTAISFVLSPSYFAEDNDGNTT